MLEPYFDQLSTNKKDHIISFEKTIKGLRLNSESLLEIDKIIKQSSNIDYISYSIEISFDSWTRKYGTIEELISDVAKPDQIQNFSLFAKLSEGTIWFNFAQYTNSLQVEGEEKWVQILSQNLENLLYKYKSPIKSIFNNPIVQMCLIISGFSLVMLVFSTKFNNNIYMQTTNFVIGIILIFIYIEKLSLEGKIIPSFLIEFKPNKTKKTIDQIIIGVIASGIFYLIGFVLVNVLGI